MKLILVGAALCAVSSPAFAQQVDGSFDGFRAEALAGYDRIDLSIGEGSDNEGKSDGVFYGGAVGYDIQLEHLLFGFDGEIGSSTNGEEISGVAEFDGSELDGIASLEDGLNWYAGVRAGTVVGSNLFYAKVGYARSTFDLDLDGTIDGEPASERVDFNFSGVRLGFGYERSFGPAFGKIEYRYTSYSDADAEYAGDTVDIEDELGEFDTERHQIVAGVGVRF